MYFKLEPPGIPYATQEQTDEEMERTLDKALSLFRFIQGGCARAERTARLAALAAVH